LLWARLPQGDTTARLHCILKTAEPVNTLTANHFIGANLNAGLTFGFPQWFGAKMAMPQENSEPRSRICGSDAGAKFNAIFTTRLLFRIPKLSE